VLSFLTPHFFDVLVILVIIVGLVLAAARIRADFKHGPRFPDEPSQPPSDLPDANAPISNSGAGTNPPAPKQ
jgi:hypothetical protein